MESPRLLIRPSCPADVPRLAAIYGDSVLHGTGTFELEAPDDAEMARRRDAIVGAGWPWLVAERGGRVAGFAYAGPFRPRRAYRWCLEDSIYLDAGARGQGVGRALLAELIARCEALGARRMLAVIGDSNNQASIALHRACGFAPAGVLEACGWKLGRWLDVVMMQRALGPGDGTAPRDAA